MANPAHSRDVKARRAALRRYRALDTRPDPVLDGIARAAAAQCETPIALVSFTDSSRRWLKACVGMSVSEASDDGTFCTHAMLRPHELMEVEDAARDDRFGDDPLVIGEPNIRFYAGKPLVTPSGIVLGTLSVMDDAPRRLSGAQRSGLERLARVVMDLLEERRGAEPGFVDAAGALTSVHGVLITDPTRYDNPIVHVNRAIEVMSGYTASELLGRNCRCLQGPETDPDTVAQLREAIAADESCTVVIRNYRKDGATFWNELTVTPVKDGAGRTVNFVGIQRDVTDRQPVEARASKLAAANRDAELARASRDRLARIVELAVNEIYVLDAATYRILDANQAARCNLGYSLETIRRLKAWNCAAGMSRERIEAMGASLHAGAHESLTVQGMHRRRNGSTYPVESQIQLMKAQTPPVFVVNVQDVTERNRVEEGARLRERAIEAVDAGVSITDATREGHPLVYVNRTLCEMTGYGLEELLGHSVNVLRRYDWNRAQQRLIQTAQAKGESCQALLKCSRKDGSVYMDELSLSPVHDDAGQLTHYIGINRDVTARLDTETRLRQAQKIDAVGQLSGGIAHDFNNLLTVISGNLEFLAMEGVTDEQRLFLDEADEAAQLGAGLTRRLLAFAQRSELEPAVLDANEQVLAAMKLLRSTIGENIAMTLRLAPDLWRVRVDPSQIESAVVNLVINARDAMPQGGQVVIESGNASFSEDDLADGVGVMPGDYVRISVTDTGSGMPPDVRSRVFEPFFTTKEPGKGTGLGLASIYGFVRQSGGHVTVHSEVGRGAVFHLYLPRHAEPSTTRKPERPARLLDTDGNGTRVLIVEDNDRVRRVTARRLSALGFEVGQASDGPAAIRQLERDSTFDLVVSDVVMSGGMSGYDVARWVQTNLPRCNILLTSGFRQDATAETNVGVGTRVLQKPYDLAELYQAVCAALDWLPTDA